MVPRVKSAKNLLTLIKIASSVITNHFFFSVDSHLISLLKVWESKLPAIINDKISSNFARLKYSREVWYGWSSFY